MLAGDLAKRRRLKFMPGGATSPYIATKEAPLKSDFDEWLVRIACFAFAYPPNGFVSLSNRSIAEQHEKQSEEEGLEPIKAWFTDWANDIIEREFSDEIEFAFSEEQEVDAVKQKEVLVGYVESGAITINQLREKIGEERDPNPAADQLLVDEERRRARAPGGGETDGLA